MSTPQGTQGSHDEAFDLIPWLVNGRLSPGERDRLERHLVDCEECRRELEDQHRLRRAVRNGDSNIEYAPQASFQKLWTRIEECGSGDESADGNRGGSRRSGMPPTETRAWAGQRRWMIAAGTILAVGLGLLAALEWRMASPDRAPEFRTASAPAAQPDRDGQIRVVFAPNVTVEELTRIVGETRLTIVDGPSGSGVYTLAVQPGRDLQMVDAIARLRADPRVRFAEPVLAASGGSP